MNAAYTMGHLAYSNGVGIDMCPYSIVDDRKDRESWCNGWVASYWKEQELLTNKGD